MLDLTISQILEAVDGKLENPDSFPKDLIIKEVSTDSRSLKGGELFLALEGENFDGHDYIEKALSLGARAVIGHKDFSDSLLEKKDIAFIRVKDSLKALQDLAAYWRQTFQIPIVAITGSNGKTTSKDMVAKVLSKKHRVHKTLGNLNNEIGLPLTILKMDRLTEVAVLEMGMNNRGEIHRLADIARPNIAIISNIGTAHIENLGSKDEILRAKAEIFDFFERDGRAILNADDASLSSLMDSLPFKVYGFGQESSAYIRAEDIDRREGLGLNYSLVYGRERYPISLSIPGKHNVYNSLSAIMAGLVLGVDLEDIISALAEFESQAMRLNIVKGYKDSIIIDDVYNASPDSMLAALDILDSRKAKRKIAVLGNMLELGEHSKKAHEKIGETLYNSSIDMLLSLGHDASYMAKRAIELGMDKSKVYSFSKLDDINAFLKDKMEKGDTLLIKGSRGMEMEKIVDFLLSMD